MYEFITELSQSRRIDSHQGDQGDTDLQSYVSQYKVLYKESSTVSTIRSKAKWMQHNLGMRTSEENELKAASLLISACCWYAEQFSFLLNCNRVIFTAYTVKTQRQGFTALITISWNNPRIYVSETVSTIFKFTLMLTEKTVLHIQKKNIDTLERGHLLGPWGCVTSILIHAASLMANPRFFCLCWFWHCVADTESC